MAGRPPIPTALKIMRGNPGHRPLPKDEPKPEVIEPTRPANLSPRAIQEWERMVPILMRMKVLTEADGQALGMLCNDIADLDEVTDQIRQTGWLVAGGRNPLTAVQSDLNRRVVMALREFGMGPASRTKVHVAKEPGTRMFDLKNAAAKA
jgi:P27 family predicted phage terminase small subunit